MPCLFLLCSPCNTQRRRQRMFYFTSLPSYVHYFSFSHMKNRNENVCLLFCVIIIMFFTFKNVFSYIFATACLMDIDTHAFLCKSYFVPMHLLERSTHNYAHFIAFWGSKSVFGRGESAALQMICIEIILGNIIS